MISALRHKSKYKSKFDFKNHIFGFPCCSTRDDLSIDVSITNVGLILTKLRGFLFSGYGQTDGQTDRRTDRRTDGQTDRHGFGILIWKHVDTQKIQLKAQNYWLAVDPYMPPRRSGMHNNRKLARILLQYFIFFKNSKF